ncbi:MAG: TolC family protein [candidate division Zixibacteria bacterium]|nr:TolC family protein [candidate division Zixibacteria bacterium]
MKIIRYAFLIVIFLMLLGNYIQAQTVTRDQFLDQLKQSHPLFEKERLTSEIEKEEQKGFLGKRDWNFNSSLFYSHEEPSFAVMGPEKTDAIVINGGLEKMFWNSGGRFSVAYSGSYIDLSIDPMLGIPGSYFENKLAMTYTHPLIKNKNGFLNKLEYNLKQFDIDLSEIIALENQENFLAGQASRFLDWVFFLEQMRIIEQRLNLSEEMLVNIREKRKANLIDEVDLIRAEDAVRISEQNLLLIETNLNALKAELAELTRDAKYKNIYPEYDLYTNEEIPSLEEATNQLRQNARLLKTFQLSITKLKYVREGYLGIRKADLSAIAQLSLKNADEDYGGSLAMDRPDALIGLQLSYPIGHSTAKSKISQTGYQLMQLEKQYEEVSLSLTSALANFHTQIVEMKAVLLLNREQIESSKRKTEEEIKLYNQGRGDLTFVIQSRDSEQGAKLNYAANALSYHKLLLQYRSLMDQIIN